MASSNSGGGVGFWGLLAILFIGLKLGGVIDWEWWVVLAPIWGPIAVCLAVLLVLAVACGILALALKLFP